MNDKIFFSFRNHLKKIQTKLGDPQLCALARGAHLKSTLDKGSTCQICSWQAYSSYRYYIKKNMFSIDESEIFQIVPFIVNIFKNTITPSFYYGIVWIFGMLLTNVASTTVILYSASKFGLFLDKKYVYMVWKILANFFLSKNCFKISKKLKFEVAERSAYLFCLFCIELFYYLPGSWITL